MAQRHFPENLRFPAIQLGNCPAAVSVRLALLLQLLKQSAGKLQHLLILLLFLGQCPLCLHLHQIQLPAVHLRLHGLFHNMKHVLILPVNLENIGRQLIGPGQRRINFLNPVEIIHHLLRHMQRIVVLLPGHKGGQVAVVKPQDNIAHIHAFLISPQLEKRIRLLLVVGGVFPLLQRFPCCLQRPLIVLLHLP